MRRTDRLLAAAAALSFAVALVAVLHPSLLPAPLRSALGTLASVGGFGALAVLALLVAVAQGLLSTDAPGRPPSMPVERAGGDGPDSPVVGATFDEHLAAAGRVGGRTAEPEAMVREDLRRLAVDVYQRVHRCDWATAARAVEAGTWTDDPSAAAFVGGADAPNVPLRVWFRAVLSDEGAFHRQTTRTIRAIYELAGDTPRAVDVPVPERARAAADEDPEEVTG